MPLPAEICTSPNCGADYMDAAKGSQPSSMAPATPSLRLAFPSDAQHHQLLCNGTSPISINIRRPLALKPASAIPDRPDLEPRAVEEAVEAGRAQVFQWLQEPRSKTSSTFPSPAPSSTLPRHGDSPSTVNEIQRLILEECIAAHLADPSLFSRGPRRKVSAGVAGRTRQPISTLS